MGTEMKAHELAELLPMMSAQEFAALKTDIADVGQQEPVLLFEGQILDGRNRYRACLELGVEPKTRAFEGTREDALNYVVSANLHRRQLKPSQRAALGVKLLPLVHEEVHKARREKLREAAKRRSEKALWAEAGSEVRANLPTPEENGQIRVRKIVADMLGIADRLIGDAQFLAEKNPERLKLVESGEMRLHAAVAPLREASGKRRGPKSNPFKKATRFLRAAKKLLGSHRDIAKAIEAVVEQIEMLAQNTAPAKLPKAKQPAKKKAEAGTRRK